MTNTIYSKDIVGKKESVVDEILLLNPNQTPLINLLDFGKPSISTTHVWYEDQVFAVKSTVTAAANAEATQLTVADTEPFVKDSIVQVDEELMLVTAVDKVAKKITVTRGYSETTPAAIVKDSEIEFLFNLAEEGGDIPTARYKPRTKKENYTQIFREAVEVSGTAQSIDQYGVGDLYDYEKAKKQLEVALQLEKSLINGIKVDNGNIRHLGGMRQFIKTNVTCLLYTSDVGRPQLQVGDVLHHIPGAVEGDRVRGFVIGEYTFEFLQESAHARIKNLA